jgi:hypothetical protein
MPTLEETKKITRSIQDSLDILQKQILYNDSLYPQSVSNNTSQNGYVSHNTSTNVSYYVGTGVPTPPVGVFSFSCNVYGTCSRSPVIY